MFKKGHRLKRFDTTGSIRPVGTSAVVIAIIYK